MQFVKERLGKWVQAAIILVVGILCIVAGAVMGSNDIASASDALDGISLVLGITLIIAASLSLLLALVAGILAKKGFAAVAIPGASILALGISLVVAKYAAALITILITVVPYLMLTIGAVILLDAIFTFVFAIQAKEMNKALPAFIVGCLVAIVAIVLGALCVGNDPVIKFGAQLIVFGIIVCLVAVFQVVTTFVKLPDTVVVVAKKEE